MTHVVAMNAWGVPERWVNEGLAVDVTGPWQGLQLDAVCKALREEGELPGLRRLTRDFGDLGSALSYPAAGSLVRFLREQYGLDTLKVVWGAGWRSLEAATGSPLPDLEAAWLARIDATDASAIDYDPLALVPRDRAQPRRRGPAPADSNPRHPARPPR